MMATQDKPSLDERYLSAVSTSNLRVAEHGNALADMVAAAGMSKQRMGMALMRLVSEWSKGATPPPAPVESVPAITKRIAQERRLQAPEVYRGVIPQDTEAAEVEARRQQDQSDAWQVQEMQLRFIRLKSLPTVRAGLLQYVRSHELEGDQHLVAAVLQRFLMPKCPECDGREKRVIAGTGRTGSKNCHVCHGTGNAKTPYGRTGERVLGYVDGCYRGAAKELAEGSRLWERTPAGKDRRQEAADRAERERLIAVSDEADQDAQSDAAAIAALFEIGKRK